MIQRFFKETLFSDFIKYLLKETPLPIYKIIKENEYMVYGCTYTYKDKILKCTKEGIFSFNDIDNKASYEIIDNYLPKAYNPKYTYLFNTSISYYDSETHCYLGEYLRQLDNIYNINLMPLYNCFNYYEVNNIHLDINLSNGVGKGPKAGYRTFLIPIKFDKEYTISIESDIPILLKPIFYKKELLTNMLQQPIINCLNSNTLIKKGSTSFSDPFIFTVTKENITEFSFLTPAELYEYERYLYLCLQIPETNTSTISILEGNYLNNTSRNIFNLYPQNNIKDEKGNIITDPNLGAYTLNTSLLNANLSLLNINDGITRPFSEKFIQYLLNNTIDDREMLTENIKRIENQIEYKPKYKGFWTNSLRYILYDKYLDTSTIYTQFNKYDVLGYVDKDVEKACRNGYIKLKEEG